MSSQKPSQPSDSQESPEIPSSSVNQQKPKWAVIKNEPLKTTASSSQPASEDIDPQKPQTSPYRVNFSQCSKHLATSQLSSTPCRRQQNKLPKLTEPYEEETIDDIREFLMKEQIIDVQDNDDKYLKIPEIQEFEHHNRNIIECLRTNHRSEKIPEVELQKLEVAYKAVLNSYLSIVQQANQEIEQLQQVSKKNEYHQSLCTNSKLI